MSSIVQKWVLLHRLPSSVAMIRNHPGRCKSRTFLPISVSSASRKGLSTNFGPELAAAQATGSSAGGNDAADEAFLASLEKYSIYQPTPVSIRHFIEFAKSANVESSFLFLKHELPVRLANIMKELQLLPKQLHKTHACGVRALILINQLHDKLNNCDFFSDRKLSPEIVKYF
jgi:hypothetical protein